MRRTLLASLQACVLVCQPGLAYADGRLVAYETEIPPGLTCLRNKSLTLVRHAEGLHNVDELTAEAEQWHLRSAEHTALREEHGIAWLLLERVSGRKYHDPMLTPKGRQQARALRAALDADTSRGVFDVVALSPMRRTIETARARNHWRLKRR